MLAISGLAGTPYLTLMPVMATRVLHGGAHTLGFLTAASGAGALVGVLYLAQRPSVLGLGHVVVLAGALFGVGLIGFAGVRQLALSLLFMIIAGAGMMVQMAASNTILQTVVDDDKRGRVMSFYAMAYFGSVPVGSLIGGALADRIGVPVTILVGGVVCIVAALVYLRELPALRRLVRPIYQQRGILPPMAGNE
jgi:MFS family permease